MDERVIVASRLKEAREYLGLSQQEVAASVGISRTAISLMESGQRKVDATELMRLARLYCRPIGFFTDEPAEEGNSDVALLARQASSLSEKDRSELLKFSEFLMERSKKQDNDDKS